MKNELFRHAPLPEHTISAVELFLSRGMPNRKRSIFGGVFCAALAIGVVLWWFFGNGLSERTAYRLSVEEVRSYAAKNDIDLSQYDSAAVGWQEGSRLYTFSWTPKNGSGDRIVITVDARTVAISVMQLPSKGKI